MFEETVLHIGEGLPTGFLRTGEHILVDPIYENYKKEIEKLQKKYLNYHFIAKQAIEYLAADDNTYSEVRIVMPNIGIITRDDSFDRLCSLIHSHLSNTGELRIITDFDPNKEQESYKAHSKEDEKGFFHNLDCMDPHSFDSYRKNAIECGRIRVFMTVPLRKVLEDCGFLVDVSEASKEDIKSSPHARYSYEALGSRIISIIAKKKNL